MNRSFFVLLVTMSLMASSLVYGQDAKAPVVEPGAGASPPMLAQTPAGEQGQASPGVTAGGAAGGAAAGMSSASIAGIVVGSAIAIGLVAASVGGGDGGSSGATGTR